MQKHLRDDISHSCHKIWGRNWMWHDARLDWTPLIKTSLKVLLYNLIVKLILNEWTNRQRNKKPSGMELSDSSTEEIRLNLDWHHWFLKHFAIMHCYVYCYCNSLHLHSATWSVRDAIWLEMSCSRGVTSYRSENKWYDIMMVCIHGQRNTTVSTYLFTSD